MAGLFDFSDQGGGTSYPPQNQGLLAMAQALLNAGRPSRTPISLGQGLGQAAVSGAEGFRQDANQLAIQKATQAQTPQDMMSALSQINDPEIQKSILANRLAAMTPKYEITKDAMGNPIAVNSLNPSQSMPVGGNPLAALNAISSDSGSISPQPMASPPSLTPQSNLGLGSTFTPAPQGGPQQGTPSAALAPPPAAQPRTGIDTAYLNNAKLISPLAASMAESMINGVFKPEQSKGENDPNYVMALQIAKRADPTFNAQSLMGRPAMVANASSGKMYDGETNLNTSLAHLYDLHELAPMTGNSPGSSPALNYIGSHATTMLGTPGAQGISRYNATVATASPEIAKYLSGATGTDTGTAEASAPYSSSLPPDTIQQNAKDMAAKMMAKGGSLQNEYNTTMGAASNHQIVQPLTQALFMDMQGKPLTAQQQQLVNQHRAESNLPPKTWNTSTLTQAKMPSAPSQADALAELRARGAIQ